MINIYSGNGRASATRDDPDPPKARFNYQELALTYNINGYGEFRLEYHQNDIKDILKMYALHI